MASQDICEPDAGDRFFQREREKREERMASANQDFIPNIPQDILDYAEALALGTNCTGGGCDYISRKAEGCEMIMADPDDPSSPRSLKAKADVCIYLEETGRNEGQWYDGIRISFPTAKKALKWMARVNIEGFRA